MPRSISRNSLWYELVSMIIIVVGMPGSGKDIFVQTAIGMGFSKIGMGDTVRHFAALADTGSGDISIGGFADSQRKEHGPAIWAERTLQRMPPGNVVIDGSRSLDEIAYFREKMGPGLRVIAVTAPAELRFMRLKARRRSDDPLTREDFERRDERELAWGLGAAMESADIALLNDKGLDEFKAACSAALAEIVGMMS